jgi:predicted O-linked N-acetylglucosamine transferase (SPINDLY family)
MAQVAEILAIARQHHQAGRLREAEAIYRQVLQVQPAHPDALHLLGVIAHQAGQHTTAVSYISQAIAHNPGAAEYHNNIGEAYRAQGKLEEAIVAYRQALARRPNYPKVYGNLGNAYRAQGKLEEAIVAYRQALALQPDFAEAYNNLGATLATQGRLTDATAAYRQALAIRPDFPEAENNLGIALGGQGKLDEAIGCFQRALALKPEYSAAYYNLGNALREAGALEKAAAAYRKALALQSDYPEAGNNLGNVLKDQGRLDEAIACFRQALVLSPDFSDAGTNLLLCLNYHPQYDPETVFKQHTLWHEAHAKRFAPKRLPHLNSRDPERPLRIGYVSADFKRHPVGYLAEPVLAAHSKSEFRVSCYSTGTTVDNVTARIQARADAWRAICGVSDDDLARLIRADGIDILVDLSGHTAGNRLLVFARKPAPVQITWIGYVNTTGLQAMDYLITDRFISPPDVPQLFTERPIRLPGCFVCFRPPEDAPPVAPCPLLSRGYPTFGCFNNISKVNKEVVGVWSEILHRVPQGRLVLKSKALSDPGTREYYRGLFLERKLEPDRVDLLGSSPYAEYLASYGQIDVALDPFPFSGCMTTCEALWMGVPVVTLGGATFASRMGVSLLSNSEMADCIAASPQEYVELATRLGQDFDQLSRLRAALRERVRASALCDATALARGLEQAYRTVWRQWCEQPDGPGQA